MKLNQLNTILFIFIPLILIGCLNQVKDTDRINQDYPFSSIIYVNYKKGGNSGFNDTHGKITFYKDNILLTVTNSSDNIKKTYKIKTVTYEDNPNNLFYRTNDGDFYVKIKNDTIKDVTFSNHEGLITFRRAKEKIIIKKAIPKPLEPLYKGWKRVEIPDVGSIAISPKLEIQNDTYKNLKKNHLKKIINDINLTTTCTNLIIQQKGLNTLNKNALTKFMRILIETVQGNNGDFSKINEWLQIPTNELKALNYDIKNQYYEVYQSMGVKILEWHPIEVIDLNNMCALKFSYKRQHLNDYPVIVECYRIQNFNKMHCITVSYRENEKEMWLPIIKKTIESFRITKIN